MPGVFLSYRRADSDYAATLYLWLRKRYGAANLFWDQKDIPPGANFLAEIDRRIDASRVFLLLIGRSWGEAGEDGRPRIEASGDVLRHEIARALQNGKKVLPVLCGGAAMPKSTELPEEIAGLPKIQALALEDLRFYPLLEESLNAAGVEPDGDRSGEEVPAAQLAVRAANLLRRQANRLLVRAKELMNENSMDRVPLELSEGVELIMALLDLLPTGGGMDLELGYLFAGYGRLYLDAGEKAKADRYLDLALAIFRHADRELEAVAEASGERASAIKGIGEIYYNRGDFREAAGWYKAALKMEPGYSYAWHDLFGAYDALAARGEIDLKEMRGAMEGLKRSIAPFEGASLPGLDRKYVASLEGRLKQWEGGTPHRPRPAVGAGPSHRRNRRAGR